MHLSPLSEGLASAAAMVQQTSTSVSEAQNAVKAAKTVHQFSVGDVLAVEAEFKQVEAQLRSSVRATKEHQDKVRQASLDLVDEQGSLERIQGLLSALGL